MSYDDLSDVDLNHPNFRAVFPDGKVPIRYGFNGYLPAERDAQRTPRANEVTLGIFLELADQCIQVTDALERFDVNRLAELREDFINWRQRGSGDCDIQAVHETYQHQRELLGEMMRGGMTLRQIARYCDVSERQVVEYILGAGNGQRADAQRVAALLACDEDIFEGDELSGRFLAEYHGVNQRNVATLRGLRAAA